MEKAKPEVFTFSELQRFMECPQKYEWSYEERVDPVYEDSVPRPVGTGVHVGVEARYNGESVEEATTAALIAFDEGVGLSEEELKKLDEKKQDKVAKGRVQVHWCVNNYPWGEDRSNVVAQEIQLEMPHYLGNPRVSTLYRGKVDRLFMVNGELWVHDTKTTGFEIGLAAKLQRLRKQYAGYVLAVEHAITQGKLEGVTKDTKVVGVMADLIAKPRIYFRKDGNTTVSQGGFHREPIHVGEAERESFTRWYEWAVEAIWKARIEERWTMNTDACFTYWLCPYFEMCRNPRRALNMVDGAKFKRREAKHRELKEAE